MEPVVSSGQVFRFGLFEADVTRNTLTRKGVRVKIHDQPLRALILLLENAGEIVSREQFRQKLWPQGTYVDFDGSLNVILKKLRAAIDDDSEKPLYVETVPRRGYRFIAPVSTVPDPQTLRPADTIRESPADGGSGEVALKVMNDNAAPVRSSPAVAASQVWVSPWKMLLLTAAAVAILVGAIYLIRPRLSSNSSAQKRVMLAVLPFQNLSNDPSQEYFSDGLTEETITDLGQLSPERMGVIARTSAMAYKHTNKTVSQIGRDLGVDYILEGSVRREGQQARISAQLIRVSDQTHLWAQTYQRQLHDLLQVQNELGTAIARQVQVNLTPQQLVDLSKVRTVDPEAYDLYLKGRFYWNQRTPGAVKGSLTFFQQAAEKDPDFALAYVGLADAYNISNIMGVYSPKESFPQAKAAATKALALDPSLAEAHAALGMEESHYDFDFPGAQREFLKAIELNPSSAYAHLFYSNCYLAPMGRISEAIAENQKAVLLDPLSLPINNFMGFTYMFAGDFEKSYQQFQHTIAMDPTFPLAHQYLSVLLTAMGRYEEALEEHEKADMLFGATPQKASAGTGPLLEAFKAEGEKGFWKTTLRLDLEAKKQAGAGYYPASQIALDYAQVGEKDEAFKWLDQAYEQREGQEITLLKVDPFFKNLRGDPRFAVLLRRMGLPK